MSRQGWIQAVPPFHTADGTAVTASATLTELSPTPQVFLPAGILGEYAGVRLEVQAWGVYTTTATQGTITFGLYSGTMPPAQAIGSAAAIATTSAITWVASQTNRAWRLEGNVQIRSTGTAGTCVGVIELSNVSSGGTDIGMTAAGSTVAIDTTVGRNLQLGATISVASQSITCRYFGVRLVN